MQTITSLYTIPEGAKGTKATLDVMRGLALNGSRSPHVSGFVDAILATCQSFPVMIIAMEEMIRAAYRFQYDPPDVETIKTPDVMIQEVYANGYCSGDCDDISTLVASILLNMRIPCRFIAIKAEKDNPEYTHVYTEGNLGFYWRRFDMTVEPNFPTIKDYGKMTVNVNR